MAFCGSQGNSGLFPNVNLFSNPHSSLLHTLYSQFSQALLSCHNRLIRDGGEGSKVEGKAEGKRKGLQHFNVKLRIQCI